jgi:hypothetical protein
LCRGRKKKLNEGKEQGVVVSGKPLEFKAQIIFKNFGGNNSE